MTLKSRPSHREHLLAVRGQLTGLAIMTGAPEPVFEAKLPGVRGPRGPSVGKSEADVNGEIQAFSDSSETVTLYRNNRGEILLPNGGRFRYGVGPNGGSDWIGWTTVIVTSEMVGKPIAVFTAVEAKRPGKFVEPGDNQDKFIKRVLAAGGKAGDARSAEDAEAIVR